MKLNRFRVLELMERAGYSTQNEFAEALGVSRQALSLWMRGRGLQLGNLAEICRILDCTPNDILVLDAPKAHAPASEASTMLQLA